MRSRHCMQRLPLNNPYRVLANRTGLTALVLLVLWASPKLRCNLKPDAMFAVLLARELGGSKERQA